ncbi:DUF4244 domain-containing protein [Aeromicrobium sp. S22]|uniref:DUF4244 domain-containing protein n=1 Tax=Aeromicrobium sp. S22 TaxID=2662029 RepID=UPI00129D7F98|nr:DUF4244 domain-containing protein [Aeromicrobium sp. S22]MRK02584.1 DUF4244 domain-containing protein [Aeromicrobium sp. S22]
MTCRDDRGMATAEYAIGTIGAVLMATALFKLASLGVDGPWLDGLLERIREALSWRTIFAGMPRLGIGA